MDDAARYRLQAANLAALGRVDEARPLAGRALAAAPDAPDTRRLLGEIELAAGCLGEARAHAGAALGASGGTTGEAAALRLLARIARADGRADDAVELAERALTIAPDHAATHVTLALALASPWLGPSERREPDAGASQRARALRAATEAVALDPELVGGYFALAVAHLADGDPVTASRALERGLELDPGWVDGHSLMGAVRLRQGMVKLASRHFAAAGRLDPSDRTQLDRLRRLAGWRRRSWGRARRRPVPWHLVPEARAVLAADERLHGSGS